MSKTNCKARVYPRDGPRLAGGFPCARDAVRDGYCAQHHPDAQAKRDAASSEKWDAESAKRNAVYARRHAEAAALSGLNPSALAEVLAAAEARDADYPIVGPGANESRELHDDRRAIRLKRALAALRAGGST